MHLQLLDFVVIGAYFVGLFLLGVFFKEQKTSDDYFLAGRRASSLLAGISVFATLFSTMSYLALPGETIRHGIGFFSSLFAFIFIIPTVLYVVIPSLMRLPVTSVYDYLEKRFDASVRTLGAWVFVIIRLVWMGLILYTASRAIGPMTGWPLPVLVLTMGVVTVCYTTMGGMRAVIWSDFAQFLILFGGAIFIPCYIAYQTGSGPMEWWSAFSSAERAQVPVFSLDPAQRITIVGMLIEMYVWNICTHGADQVAAQRYLSTPSAATAKRSFVIFSLANVGVLSLLMVVGIALFYFRFQTSGLPIEAFQRDIAAHADDVLPQFLAGQLPTGISGLMLAALLAAAMSSLSSGINSISAVIVSDLLPSQATARRSEPSLAMSRFLATVAGTFAIVGALAIIRLMSAKPDWNLVDLLERINHLFVAPLGALFFAGIFFRHVGTAAVVIGFFAGVVASLLISFSEWLFQYEISFMWIMPGAFLVSLLVTYLTGWFFRPPTATQLAGLYRGSASVK
ncbi:MAG: sodium/solute symporter [Pirellulales bacterium]